MLGYLRMAPWRRGPFLLLRRPGVFVALAAAAFVATLPGAAAGPFVSSSRHATLRDQIASACPSFAGDWVTTQETNPPLRFVFGSRSLYLAAVADANRAAHAAAARVSAANAVASGLAPVRKTQVLAAVAGKGAVDVLDRPGFQDNVTVLSGPTGEGLWIPNTYADAQYLRVGSIIRFAAQGFAADNNKPPSTSIRVAAIYRDLRSEPRRPFWCGLTQYWNPPTPFDAYPPPVLLADGATFAKALPGTLPDPDSPNATSHTVYVEWQIRSQAPTVAEAKVIVASIGKVNAAMGAKTTQPDPTDKSVRSYKSDLSDFLPRTDLAAAVMRPAIAPITGVGIGVGLAVVAAAGMFWVLRRRTELTVLSAHGMSARSLGVKAVLEALPALILGAAGGWASAIWLVRTAGPSPIIAPDSIRESIEAAAATFAGTLVLVGFVAALRCRSLADEKPVRRLPAIGRLPWELLLIVAAPFLWRWYGNSSSVNGNINGQTAGVVVHVPQRLLVVPILCIIGVIAFAGRLWVLALRRRPTGRGRALSRFLAGRRVVREAVIAVVLAVGVALPVCMAVYGAAITESVRTTLDAKALLYTGSDVVLTLPSRVAIPPEFASHATAVVRLNGVLVNGTQTDLLGIDENTFGRAAFWDAQITGQSLAEIVAPLRSAGTLASPVILVAGATDTGSSALDIEAGGPVTFDVRAIETLPAQHSGFPDALVDQSLIAKAPSAQFQIWIRGDPTTILSEVAKSNLRPTYTQTTSDITVNSVYEPLTFTFTYLTALSLLCGVIAIVGLLLYLEARAPRHRQAFVMLRRMGMAGASHWRAMLWELGTPLIVGLVIGLGASSIAAYALRHYYDVDPALPPGGLLTMPFVAMLGIATAVVVVMIGASAYAQFRVQRANASEVLRDVA